MVAPSPARCRRRDTAWTFADISPAAPQTQWIQPSAQACSHNLILRDNNVRQGLSTGACVAPSPAHCRRHDSAWISADMGPAVSQMQRMQLQAQSRDQSYVLLLFVGWGVGHVFSDWKRAEPVIDCASPTHKLRSTAPQPCRRATGTRRLRRAAKSLLL